MGELVKSESDPEIEAKRNEVFASTCEICPKEEQDVEKINGFGIGPLVLAAGGLAYLA